MRNKTFVLRSGSEFMRIFTFIASFILAAFFTQGALAKNDVVYTVAKFKVEAKAKNAVLAKKKAIAEGREAAFKYLLHRLTGYSSHSRLPRVDSRTIEAMTDGLRVRSNSNSGVKYIGSLDFNFRADAVRKLLRSYSIPILEEQSDKIIIVPYFLSEDFSKKTTRIKRGWRKAWLAQDLIHTLTPVQLAHAKAGVTKENIKAVLQGNGQIFNEIRESYVNSHKSEYFILAIATSSGKAGMMDVRLVGNDAAGYFQLQRDYKIGRNGISWDSEKAAHYSMQVIQGRWKIIRSEELGDDEIASTPENILVTVVFSGFKEWQTIRTKINKIPGVDGLEVGSLSARGAEVSLLYPGGAERLSQHLGKYSLMLENENGAWIMRGL